MKSTTKIAAVIVLAALTCVGAWAQDDRPLIGEVVVEGNDFVAREPILAAVQDVLKVGEEYTEAKGAEAINLISRMGYFDEVTLSTEPLDEGARVVITVVEKQRIEEVLFAGNTVISDEQLRAEILSETGHIYDERAIGRDVRRIEEFYASKGYSASVSEARLDEFGALTFVVEEARIERIVIDGLDRTQPWVIRREIDIEPGELFQREKLSVALRRIHATGLFDEVELAELRPGEENPLRDVIPVIEVAEAKTGRAAFALGWSSLDDLVVMLSAEEKNLRGQGERASVSLELGGRESYEISFSDPYLDSKGTTFEINLFDSQRRRQFVGGAAISTADNEFDERRTGGDFTVVTPIADRRSVSLTVRSVEVSSSLLQGTTIISPGIGTVSTAQTGRPGDRRENPVPSNPDLSPDAPEPGDMSLPIRVAAPLHPGGRVNSLKLGLIDDTRDVRSNPRSGAMASLSYEQAGALLGGGTEFGKVQLDYRRYFGLGDDVVAVRLMGGTTFGSPPLFESFTVGGANTLRGYEPDRWRGENLLLGNIEYRKRINDSLTGVGFVDVGSAYGGTFETIVPGFEIQASDASFEPHVGAGVGLRVVTPIGPIRLDMGFGEEGSQAHFSFGHTF